MVSKTNTNIFVQLLLIKSAANHQSESMKERERKREKKGDF